MKTCTTSLHDRSLSGQARQASPALVLLSLGLLYISFGVCFGLLEYGIPPILLSQGVDLQAMGWVIALYIPFGLTFLWAPVVDRISLPWLSHRIGWIALCQIVSSGLLIAIAFGSSLPAAGMFFLGLAVCFAVATMDLALDALAVDMIGPKYRSVAAALKVSALALGGMLGGGILVGLFPQLGWKGTFFITALLPMLTILPVLMLTKAENKICRLPHRASLLVTFRRKGVGKQLLQLSVATTFLIGLFYFQRPILVSMGASLERIGWTLGTLSPMLNALAAMIIIPLMSRFGSLRTMALLLIITALAAAGTVISHGLADINGVIIWSLLQAAVCTALSVIIYALILKWAATDQSATDYAVLCGASRLLATLFLMGVPTVLPYISWGVFYGVSVVLLAGICFSMRRQVQKMSVEE
ncbi:MFS transporter [Pantoea agglomerans]|uniref:MFS transporter n=1 Tax=Enterobacter agglomerans TaxID=549 RepID=UPI0011B0393E|nr:MFS transporter [Pantoea agglomerans]UBN52396.1 hypothetical protein LB453_02230 [Pantoea agglomerans]